MLNNGINGEMSDSESEYSDSDSYSDDCNVFPDWVMGIIMGDPELSSQFVPISKECKVRGDKFYNYKCRGCRRNHMSSVNTSIYGIELPCPCKIAYCFKCYDETFYKDQMKRICPKCRRRFHENDALIIKEN